jgi:hypothetical protein
MSNPLSSAQFGQVKTYMPGRAPAVQPGATAATTPMSMGAGESRSMAEAAEADWRNSMPTSSRWTPPGGNL